MASSIWLGAVRTAVATAAFGVLHSVMADHRLKDAAERAWGTRRRNAFYRPIYNIVSVTSLLGLIVLIRRQPSRTLYHVRGPAALALRGGQAAGLGVLAAAAWKTGPLKFAGVPSLLAWILRKRDVPRPPAGQGPDRFADGSVKATGPFQHLRQPANMAMIPLLCLQPKMTSRFAAFCAVTAAYAIVGSIHSDRVLREEYGSAYDDYRRKVPMLVPKLNG